MKRLCAPLVYTGVMFLVLIMPGISKALANQITLSCVFQGAGALKKTITVDLQKNTVTNGYSNYKVSPIKQVTDSVVKWHEEISATASSIENELDRITGDLTSHIVQGGQSVVWTYSCQRIQKQF